MLFIVVNEVSLVVFTLAHKSVPLMRGVTTSSLCVAPGRPKYRKQSVCHDDEIRRVSKEHFWCKLQLRWAERKAVHCSAQCIRLR